MAVKTRKQQRYARKRRQKWKNRMKVLAMILGLLATFAIFLFGAAGIKDFIKKQAEIEVANTVQTPSVTEEKDHEKEAGSSTKGNDKKDSKA